MVYFTERLQNIIPFQTCCISHTLSSQVNKSFDQAVPLSRCSAMQVLVQHWLIFPWPYLIHPQPPTSPIKQTVPRPTQTGCLETRSAVSNYEMSCCESHGDVDGSWAATPHTETRKDTKRRSEKEYGVSAEQKIVRVHRENLRTSQLQVPSTPTLLINLWGLASLYRDCFHQTARAINRVAADMLFNKSVGAPFPIQTSKELQIAWCCAQQGCYFWAVALASSDTVTGDVWNHQILVIMWINNSQHS